MKKFLIRFSHVVISTVIATCLSSCAFLLNKAQKFAEGSVDLASLGYSGDDYYDSYKSTAGVGPNFGLMMMLQAPPKDLGTSFYQQPHEYKYQLAYAAESPTSIASGDYRYRPSLAPKASDRFIDRLNLFTGLEFVQKNSKEADTKVRLSYLQIPILVLYMHDLGNDRKVFGGLGPYFAYGIGGKFKGDGFSEKAFNDDFGFKRFDAGLTFTGGYRFNSQWHVRLAFDLGLANLEHDSDFKRKNRCLSLNVGYSLDKWVKKLSEK